MNQSALELLKNNITTKSNEFGYSPYSLAQWMHLKDHRKIDLMTINLDKLDKNLVDRDVIFEKIRNPQVSTLECSIYILAWGGMRRSNALKAFENYSFWLPICEDIRNGKLSRTEAFEKFVILRNKFQLNGMGPAFFTKLIFFLMSRKKNSGYIMDQWTARSINLLFNQSIVKTKIINKNKKNEYAIVSDDNNSANYEQFCLCIEEISKILDSTPEATELSLFSEGRGRGVWRNYVKNS